ncbi:MAG TPA: FHIPEP family type III secretion protein [Anaerohalosphaeraceae bacterium]|nr:FHIPEP family type III secretion protein [Anaerohalosphaeraceae bacterium]HRT49452.1 FHIPEP family type III secretion protein [Anaerohalosphaeraceae bacterium]HRT85384.1 FHIPEP family type III secretion protein [Anaerohalosphaeraceae bacterium]
MTYTAGTLCVRIMSNERPDCQQKPRGVLVARSDFIAVAAAVSVLGGAFLPAPAWLLDILWGCSLCLSAALVLIGLTGKDPLELAGFGPLMVLGALLRMGLSTATAGLVFRGETAGTLIETAGSALCGAGAVTVLLAMPLASGLFASLVFRSTGRIIATAVTCLTETIPEQEAAVALDEQAGLVRPQRAGELKERLFGQTGFYLNMGGVARLLRCEVVIGAGAVMTIIVGQLTVFTLRDAMNAAALQEIAKAAAGGGILMLVPMWLVCGGAARLVVRSRNYLSLPDDSGDRQRGEVIEIISQETGRAEQVELLNPDFVEVSARAGGSEGTAEQIVDLEPCTNEEDAQAGTQASICADDYYECLAAHVADLQQGKTSVLFAARTSEELPVTVVVNVGIRLAGRGLRTLLIDADAEREAVAAVFEADIESMDQGPVATCVQNLAVWGVGGIARAGVAVDTATQETAGDYDRVILYAPNLMQHERRRHIADAATSAIVFAREGRDRDLETFLQQAGCTTIETRYALRRDGRGLSEHG